MNCFTLKKQTGIQRRTIWLVGRVLPVSQFFKAILRTKDYMAVWSRVVMSPFRTLKLLTVEWSLVQALLVVATLLIFSFNWRQFFLVSLDFHCNILFFTDNSFLLHLILNHCLLAKNWLDILANLSNHHEVKDQSQVRKLKLKNSAFILIARAFLIFVHFAVFVILSMTWNEKACIAAIWTMKAQTFLSISKPLTPI